MKNLPSCWIPIITFWYNRISYDGYPLFFRFKKCVTLPKKGTGLRPICITSLLAKIYDIILGDRLTSACEKYIPPNQCAYLKKRRGCEENLLLTKIICEKYPDVSLHSFDWKSAFNCIPNCKIFKTLSRLNIDPALKRCIYDAVLFFIIFDPEKNKYFSFFRGLPQGGVFSGFLFLLCISDLSTSINKLILSAPISFKWKLRILITHIFFADDLLIFSLCTSDSMIIINFVFEWAAVNGLPLNFDKCATLNASSNNTCKLLPIEIKQTYLGVDISITNGVFNFSRPCKNIAVASKISSAVYKITNIESLLDCIRSFNGGPYAYPVIFSDFFSSCSTINNFDTCVKYKDNYIRILLANYIGGNAPYLLSHSKCITALGCQSYKFSRSIVRYSSDFLEYIESLPDTNLAKNAIFNSKIYYNLNYCRTNFLPTCPKNSCEPVFWLKYPKCILKIIAPFFLFSNLDHSIQINKDYILALLQAKHFQELKEYVDKHSKSCSCSSILEKWL